MGKYPEYDPERTREFLAGSSSSREHESERVRQFLQEVSFPPQTHDVCVEMHALVLMRCRELNARLKAAEATIARVETYLADIEEHCSTNRYDVPSWVGGVRAALNASIAPESPCPTPCDDDCDAACHEAHQPTWKRTHESSEEIDD